MLNEIIEDNKIKKLQNYFASLNQNNNDKITLSKIVNEIDCSEDEAALILNKCIVNGIVGLSFGIRCPECGMLIKKIESNDVSQLSLNECYSCGECIEVSEMDIVALFYLKVDIPPFELGQREKTVKINTDNQVALCDTLKALSVFGFDENIFKSNGVIIHNNDVEIKKELLNKQRAIEIEIDKKVFSKYITNRNLLIILLLSLLVLGIIVCFKLYDVMSQKNAQIYNIIAFGGMAICPILAFLLKLVITIDKNVIREDIYSKYKYKIIDLKQQIEEINNKYR
ncbi:MAG: hypothetical protein ACERKZ_05755 [Lachnotalea sp.]